MPAPVINTTTSVLGYKQGESWTYQPYATNTPTSWACPNLPAGVTFNTTSGRMQGPATEAGVFVLGVTATNGDGTSPPLILTLGIEAAALGESREGVEIEIDVESKVARILSGAEAIFGRVGDDLMLWIRFVKGGRVLDLDIVSLAFAFRELDTERTVVIGDAWGKVGSGIGTSYGVHAKLDRAKLQTILSNYEDEESTRFTGRAEVEWICTNDAGFGPDVIRSTSEDLKLTIASDKIEIEIEEE